MNTRKIKYNLQRQKILDKSLELFSQKGFAQTSVVDIARESNISKGLLYHYFSGKEQLFEVILTNSFNIIFEYLDTNKDSKLTQREFEELILNVFKSLEQNFLHWKLVFQLFTQPELSEKTIQILDKNASVTKFRNIISDYFKGKNKINPQIKTTYFISVILGISVSYIQNPIKYPLKQIVEFMIEEFIKN
jgi:AcrR family transcriptional regulator